MLIAQALGLSEDMIETIGGAAPLHDMHVTTSEAMAADAGLMRDVAPA